MLKSFTEAKGLVSRVGTALAAAALLVSATRYVYRRLTVVNRWNLTGKVAVVTGGSRGVGRGVCLELGRAGATVYVIGRSRNASTSSSSCQLLPGQGLRGESLGGSIDETAAEVTRLGGVGIAVECDCSDDSQMESVFDKVRRESGQVDILVNCAIMIRDDIRQKPPFWEQEVAIYDSYHVVGTRSTYVMSTLAARLMLDTSRPPAVNYWPSASKSSSRRALIVNVSSPGSKYYMFNVAYGVGKAGLDRIGKDMHVDVRRSGALIDVVTLHPGMVQTERMLRHKNAFRRTMHTDVDRGESVNYTGRAVCALASDPSVAASYSGRVVTCTTLAKQLNFTDVNGTRPADPFTLSFYIFHVLPVLAEDLWRRLVSEGPNKQQEVRRQQNDESGR